MKGQALSRAARSAPARFLLLYLVVTICGTIPVLFFIYHQTGRIIVDLHSERIEDHRRSLLHSYAKGSIPDLAGAIRADILDGTAAHSALLLVDPRGRRIAGNIATWPPTLRDPTDWREMRLYRNGHGNAELFAISTNRLPSGHRLLIGTRVEDLERMQEALLIALAGAFLLAIPIGLGGGFVMLRAANKRVDQIGQVAVRIAAGDLSHRLESSDEGDDAFSRLAGAINGMLGRIEELVEQLRLVTDALAHDLRSPLMRIRTNNERLAGQLSENDRQRAVEAISNEIDSMLRLISATLEISRTEAGIGRENFAEVDFHALLRDLCEMYNPLAEDLGLPLSVSACISVAYNGNRELLGQALSNLIDNALKYAEGGSITLGAGDDGKNVLVWVADTGRGIPEHQHDEAMAKYRRLEQARTREGSGLGLAFVRAVARLHGGDLVLKDNKPGLRAIITLPRAVREA